MDETGLRMTEKGGRREDKRVQMMVFEGQLSCGKRGVNNSICYYTREKFFPAQSAKILSEHDKRDK